MCDVYIVVWNSGNVWDYKFVVLWNIDFALFIFFIVNKLSIYVTASFFSRSFFRVTNFFHVLAFVSETAVFLYLGFSVFIYHQKLNITFTLMAIVRVFCEISLKFHYSFGVCLEEQPMCFHWHLYWTMFIPHCLWIFPGKIKSYCGFLVMPMGNVFLNKI